MKSIATVFRHSPHGSAHGREGIDLALLSASFEQQVSLLFIDEGVLCLVKDQQAELVGAKDFTAVFGAFPLYDIETVIACESSMKRYGIDESAFSIPVQAMSSAQIAEHLNDVDEVLVF